MPSNNLISFFTVLQSNSERYSQFTPLLYLLWSFFCTECSGSPTTLCLGHWIAFLSVPSLCLFSFLSISSDCLGLQFSCSQYLSVGQPALQFLPQILYSYHKPRCWIYCIQLISSYIQHALDCCAPVPSGKKYPGLDHAMLTHSKAII